MSSSCCSACAWQCWWEQPLVWGLCFLCSRFSEPDPSHTLEERVVHWYFSQLDNNSSNDINKRELKPFKRYVKKKAKPKKCARRFTDYCDLNKDKSISLQELKGCLGVSKEGGEFFSFSSSLHDIKNWQTWQIKTELLQIQFSISCFRSGTVSVNKWVGSIHCHANVVCYLCYGSIFYALSQTSVLSTIQKQDNRWDFLARTLLVLLKSLETVVKIRSLLNNTLLTRSCCLSHAGWMMYEPSRTQFFSGDPVY